MLWGSKGAAIATFCAELAVLLIQVRLGRSYIPFKYFDDSIKLYVLSSILMGVAVYLTSSLFNKPIIQLLVPTCIGIVVYFLILYYKKDDILFSVLRYIHVIK